MRRTERESNYQINRLSKLNLSLDIDPAMHSIQFYERLRDFDIEMFLLLQIHRKYQGIDEIKETSQEIR